jgi:hypothetical protein
MMFAMRRRISLNRYIGGSDDFLFGSLYTRPNEGLRGEICVAVISGK